MGPTLSLRKMSLIQSGFFALIVVLSIILLTDITKNKNKLTSENRSKTSEYTNYLLGGLKFLFSSKVIFLFLIGTAIYNATWIIWGSIILSPLYFGYSGTDAIAGILRTSLTDPSQA